MIIILGNRVWSTACIHFEWCNFNYKNLNSVLFLKTIAIVNSRTSLLYRYQVGTLSIYYDNPWSMMMRSKCLNSNKWRFKVQLYDKRWCSRVCMVEWNVYNTRYDQKMRMVGLRFTIWDSDYVLRLLDEDDRIISKSFVNKCKFKMFRELE